MYNNTQLGLYVTTSQASRLSAMPGQQTVTQGTSSASYQLSVTGINAYTGTFNFQCTGSSLCSSVTFVPPAVTGTGTSTMTVATGSTAPGTYGITVMDNQQNVSTAVLLTVTSYGSPGFTLNTSQTPQAVVANGQSQSVPFTITATPQNGFNASIGLACTGLPSGVSNGFTYNSMGASNNYSTVLFLIVDPSAAVGTATCLVTGTAGSIVESTSVQVQIYPPLTQMIASQPSVSFSVTNQPCTGSCTFAPGPQTLTVAPTQSATNIPSYAFSVSDSSIAKQVAVAPGPGSVDPNGQCPWRCRNGSCSAPTPIGPPSPPPVISSIDAPAALYAGGAGTITIHGSNFGSVAGMLNFCPGTIQNPDYNSCVLPSSATPMSYCSSSTCSTGSQNDTWTDTEIVATVTLPETTPTGGWWVFVTSVAFIAAENFLNPSMGNLEVDQEPTVVISCPFGIPLDGSGTCSVTASPSGTQVLLMLNTGSGSGSATFDDGTTTKIITASTNSQPVTIKGVQTSSTADNITIAASVDGETLTSQFFSVVSVSIALNAGNGAPLAADDTASAAFLGTVVSGGPLGQQISNSAGYSTCSIGKELVGAVSPSNYYGTVTLQRDLVSGTVGQFVFSNVPPGPDNSDPLRLVTTPTVNGNVYDLDAPGINPSSPSSHARYNFQEYAVLGTGKTANRVPGSAFAFYARSSCMSSNGQPAFDSGISGDNKAGAGTTPLTLNFQ